jgi:iron(III) transport system substrate-binding protein
MFNSTRRALLGTLLVCGAVGASQPLLAQAADEALIAAAKKEGLVYWYTSFEVNALARPLSAAFEKKYGIPVKFSRQNAGETAIKLTNEARAGNMQADAVDASVGVFGVLGNVLDDLAAAGVPVSQDAATAKTPLWAGATRYFYSAAVNTDLVKPGTEPKTYEDLLDPKWSGKINWTDDPTVNGPPGFIGNVLMTMGQEKGMNYLRKLAAQKIANIPGNHRVSLDQVIAGEYAIGLMNLNHQVAGSAKQGAPIAWLNMNPVVQTTQYVGLIKNRPHKAAGVLFVSYILSDEGQAFIRDAGYVPASATIKPLDPKLTPEGGGFTTTQITPQISRDNLDGWIKIFEELFR